MTAWHISYGQTQNLLPPWTPTPYPGELASGSVALYPDNNWEGDPYIIHTSAYTEKVQASLAGTPLQDRATYVAFNLPVGTVMTLLQSVTAPVPGQPYNFAEAGVCVDLIGDGRIQTVDLPQINANDCISGFIWRRVNQEAGIFQLFDGDDWSGSGNTFFLSEWPANTIHSLSAWNICDNAGSIYFGGLGLGAVTLYDGTQGDGQSAQFGGWLTGAGPNDTGANLVERGFGDREASWQWSPLPPVYQVVEPFTINSTVSIDESLSVMLNSSGSNTGDSTVTQTAKFTYTISQEATVTVTQTSIETYTQTTGFTFGQSFGVANVASTMYAVTLNFGFSEQFSDTISETDTLTETLASELSQVVSVPANSDWKASLILQYAKVPPTSFTTTGRYYYEQQVPGSVPDPVMAAQLGYEMLYALTATLSGYVEASLSLNARSSVTTTPMGSSQSTTTDSMIETIPVPNPAT